jgi:histidinol dehydrogenase
MRIIDARNSRDVEQVVSRDAARDPAVVAAAARIVADVRRRGDAALDEWTRRFAPAATGSAGRVPGRARPLVVSRRDLEAGWKATPPDVREAIRLAMRNIEAVASRQLPRPFAVTVQPGVRIEQRVQPLARVGCYVPGGRFPLPSTLLMTAIPAKIAGVEDVVVACPAPGPALMCAAVEAGVDRVYRMGGAQAIAALAYGTGRVQAVDKIVGPGNAWVAAAKSIVSRDCAIDFHAGPSEIVICASSGRPGWIAADLVAQAEHDPSARAILVTADRTFAVRVQQAVRALICATGIRTAALALRRHGAIILTRSTRESIAIVNRLAPEHLVCDRHVNVDEFRAAGTVFVGAWSAQAAGDYCTGSNHVLPTGGAARFRGGLGAADFVRVFTVQRLSPAGLRAIGPPVIALAEAEGLAAHATSIRVRL